MIRAAASNQADRALRLRSTAPCGEGEGQLVGGAGHHRPGELVDEEPRQRYRAAAVGLGGAPHQPRAVYLGDCLLDQYPPAQQIEVPYPQRRQFRPAQPAVAEHQNGDPAGAGGVGERLELLGGQVPPWQPPA